MRFVTISHNENFWESSLVRYKKIWEQNWEFYIFSVNRGSQNFLFISQEDLFIFSYENSSRKYVRLRPGTTASVTTTAASASSTSTSNSPVASTSTTKNSSASAVKVNQYVVYILGFVTFTLTLKY